MKKLVMFGSILLCVILLFSLSQKASSSPGTQPSDAGDRARQVLDKVKETVVNSDDSEEPQPVDKEDKRATQESSKETKQAAKEETKEAREEAKDETKEARQEALDEKKGGKKQHLKGLIEAVNAETLSLTLKDGSSATVAFSADTRIKIPGEKDATLADLKVGMEVVVQAVQNEETLLAKSLSVIPGKPTKLHRVGIVTEYIAGSSITIQAKDGSTSTYAIDPEVIILPAAQSESLGIGAKVTIIAPKSPSGDLPVAKGIVIHPQTTEEEPDTDS